MGISEKYLLAYEKLDQITQKHLAQKCFPAMGYTSNLDLLCDFKIETLNKLLKKYLPEAKLSDIKSAEKVVSIETLLKTIVFFCLNGIGGEVDVENIKVLEESFKWKYGMGGTAVQAAMALAAIGCPSIVHLTDDSREVCDILDSPYIYTVSKNGELIHTNEVVSSAEQEIHFIIQFKKGDMIKLGKEEIQIPLSNRLILTKITVNEFVPFSDSYFKYIEKNASRISSNVLSSFNALSDKGLLMKRLNYVKQHLRKYKNNNPSGMVFFEDAHYHNSEIRKLCLETIYSQVDIVSLNEEELKYTLEMYNFPINIESIISSVEGARFIKEKFRVQKGIIVHTKDYSMYVGNKLEVDIESGLIYGNLLATAKAENGWYGNKSQLKELLKLPLSSKGVEAKNIISTSEYAGEVVIIPTKYIDKPKYTIGLGDSFVGGVQLCF
ncbi:ADP-dependent glucokinase/phosphofructokinase [Halocella sp. SP3-1]|uniref:ADP-dependent glucokinase/phosphofructokinase n=1 Tax=Halocella sp. SP3-1 TaxID=2382161 RepID=UPI000F75E03C|nr:ADP-dependent glucokinase/phosphofructokinase [Halocella sp. SP3-1]AZO94512.1 ADP-dependent glucokinase [Halocella sp. SP3-1]